MNKIITGIIVIVVLALGGWWAYTQMTKAPTTQTEVTPSTQTETVNNPDQSNSLGFDVQVTTAKTHQVLYTDSGYSPSTLTIKTGDTVVFKNQSSGNVWTSSAMHPTHMLYGGTSLQQHCPDPENDDLDQCKSEGPGSSWSFTFTKAGTWGYHNHVGSSHFGKVVVE